MVKSFSLHFLLSFASQCVLLSCDSGSKSGQGFAQHSTARQASPEAAAVATARVESVRAAESHGASTLSGCSTQPLRTEVLRLDFPPSKGQCNWERGMAGGKIMGHFEQTLKLPVASNWVVCAMSISSDKTDFVYDDYFLLHFNDRALMGSTGLVDMLEKDEAGLPKYQLSNLQGKSPEGANICMQGHSKCSLPGTEQNGPLRIELNESVNMKLMELGLKEKRFDFQVVTFGDNDTAIDCQQSGLPLDVTLKYFVK